MFDLRKNDLAYTNVTIMALLLTMVLIICTFSGCSSSQRKKVSALLGQRYEIVNPEYSDIIQIAIDYIEENTVNSANDFGKITCEYCESVTAEDLELQETVEYQNVYRVVFLPRKKHWAGGDIAVIISRDKQVIQCTFGE